MGERPCLLLCFDLFPFFFFSLLLFGVEDLAVEVIQGRGVVSYPNGGLGVC